MPEEVIGSKKVSNDVAEKEIEHDDFALPMQRKTMSESEITPARMDSRQDLDARRGSKDQPSEAGISSTAAIEDEDSDGGDEFKDATSSPVSGPPTPKLPVNATDYDGVADLGQRHEGISPEQKGELPMVKEGVDGKAESVVQDDEQPPGSLASMTTSNQDKIVVAVEPLDNVKPTLTDAADAHHGDKAVDTAELTKKNLSHQRRQTLKNGISEWSHQHMTQQAGMVDNEEEDEGWQEMPAYAPYDIYDDNNRLIAREAHDTDDEAGADAGLGGAGKGYTRVQLDEDVQSATSLDDDTKYLFKEVNGTSAADIDDEQRDALSQMQATKDLLTEGQKIAYVGTTRLALTLMVKEAEAIPVTKNTKKEVQMSAEAMKMWSQKMMVRLYHHMDISTDEQIMIEQLSEHGVEPADLTPTLMQNARVKNPMAAASASSANSLASPRPGSTFSETRSPDHSVSSPRFDHEEVAPPPAPYVDHDGADLPEVRTPSQLPTTKNIDIDLRWTVLCDLFLTLIADSVYDARSRVVLERLGKYMGVDWVDICRFEKRVTDALEMQQAAEKENWNEEEHKEARRKMALNKRYLMMGLATVGGGLVIGLSAGLLAPVIGAGLAAGFTTIGVAGTSTFLASTSAAAIITTGAAASGGIIAVRAAARRTGAVKTFEYRPLHNNKRVNLIVTVSGWMTGKVDDVRLPYSTVDPVMGDIYSVLWEPEMLTSMGDTINILATEALTQGLQQVLGSTILIGLMSALQLPVVLTKLAYLIDNPWTVSLDRANATGLILADSLIDRNLGTRPITFVGYSLGSRVIFSCLRELAKMGAYGLVQNVYLFGSPIVANRDDYLRARSVVAGRFVNGYARTDWILGYLFRLTSGGISRVAGLAPIEGIPGIENVDVTEFVPGHMSYRTAMPRLLREVGWLVESDEFSEIEDPDPENHQKRQRELINEIEEARKELDKEGSKGRLGSIFGKKKKLAKRKEWETYQESKDTGEGGNTKGLQGDYGGVLFDVEAIRAEVESQQMEVREIKSTLPPMRLDLKQPGRSVTAPVSPRDSLHQNRSLDASSMLRLSPTPSPGPASARFAPPPRLQPSPSPSYHNGNAYGSSVNLYSYGQSNGTDSDQIEMTFEASPTQATFGMGKENDRSASESDPCHGHVATHPPKAEPSDRVAVASRPELKSSATLPVLATAAATSPLPTMNIDRETWVDDADDDEFSQEREMEMTFA